MMFIDIETKNEWLNEINEVPIIGDSIIFLYSVLPLVFLMIINWMFAIIDETYIDATDSLIAGLWNIVLTFDKSTKITILFIPCWIIFTIVGIVKLAYFIIG